MLVHYWHHSSFSTDIFVMIFIIVLYITSVIIIIDITIMSVIIDIISILINNRDNSNRSSHNDTVTNSLSLAFQTRSAAPWPRR